MPDLAVMGTHSTSQLVQNREFLYFLRNGMDFTIRCSYQRLNPDVDFIGVRMKKTAITGGNTLFTSSFAPNDARCQDEWTSRCSDITFDACADCDNDVFSVTISDYDTLNDEEQYECGVDISTGTVEALVDLSGRK